MDYLLPSHPSKRCSDPLSLTNKTDPTVWEVIEAAIKSYRSTGLTEKSLATLPEFLDTLSYSLHGNGIGNANFLLDILYKEFEMAEALKIVDHILNAALDLPLVFPSNSIRHLTPEEPYLSLYEYDIRTLIAHQALGTLTPPVGNTWGCNFIPWYSEPQALPHAVRGYILTMLRAFRQSFTTSEVMYRIYTPASFQSSPTTEQAWKSDGGLSPFSPFDHLTIEPVSAQTVQFPHPRLTCQLVSANKEPGFGCSCTQEELLTAACPALLPLGAILLSPPLADDGVILVQDAYPITTWEGQGRDARLTGFVNPRTQEERHSFLLMDALEFDGHQASEGIPDLVPQNILRELIKAWTGFEAIRDHRGIFEISSRLWGTGAFNGDPVVKTLILTMAAAKANITVYLSVEKERTYVLPSGSEVNLLSLLTGLQKRFANATPGKLWRILTSKSGLTRLFEETSTTRNTE